MYDGIKRRCVQCGEIYIDGSIVCHCCKCPTKRMDGIDDRNFCFNSIGAFDGKTSDAFVMGKQNSTSEKDIEARLCRDRLIFIAIFILLPIIIILIEGMF